MKKSPLPKRELINKLHFFHNVAEEDLEQIMSVMELRAYKNGEFIISEGEPGGAFFLLFTGSAYVLKRVEGNSQEVLNVIDKPGDFFGEMSLLEDRPRSAGVVAAEDSEVLAIEKDDFFNLINTFPHINLLISRSIAERLRRSDWNLIQTLRAKNLQLEKAYKQLQETQNELLRKERLSMVGRLASSILHDIRNPMSTIKGYAQLIQTIKNQDEKVGKYADVIVSEVERLSNMAQELLTFAKGEVSLNQELVDLTWFLDDFFYFVGPEFEGSGMKVVKDFKFTGQLKLDKMKFHRALQNIAKNAWNAMRKGGTFSISTEHAAGKVVIYLADDGDGMSEDVKARVFEEFFSYGKTEGTGLGLAITKQIVEEHKGIIFVESKLGEGTKFTVELPLE